MTISVWSPLCLSKTELQSLLEETQLVVQTVVGSRFVAPLRKEADGWQQRLRLLAEVIEAWRGVQAGWMYLEAVFAAPDIQRQLQPELRLFAAVDKAWRPG